MRLAAFAGTLGLGVTLAMADDAERPAGRDRCRRSGFFDNGWASECFAEHEPLAGNDRADLEAVAEINITLADPSLTAGAAVRSRGSMPVMC